MPPCIPLNAFNAALDTAVLAAKTTKICPPDFVLVAERIVTFDNDGTV
jgi:hypothetical protein